MHSWSRLHHVAPLALAFCFAACGGSVVVDETGPGSGGGAADIASDQAGGGTAPLTCDVVSGPIDLVPASDNPVGCRGAVACEVWFGHGQHLSCPGPGLSDDPSFAECSIWDCLCTIVEVEGFAANFATGEVVDTRVAGLTCRYTLEPPG